MRDASLKTDFILVILLWFAGLGAAAQYAKVSVVFERLGEVFPQAGAAIGLAVSLVGFVGVVLGVVAGVVVSRLGYRRALLSALVLGALISALEALLPPFGAFLVLRVFEGASHLAIVVAIPTLIAEVSEARHRGFTLTLWSTFFSVAFALLVVLGLPLVELGGERALFLAHAVYMLACAAVLALRLKPVKAGGAEPMPKLREVVATHRRIYATPRLSAPALVWLAYTMTFLTLLTLLPPYIEASARAFTATLMPLVAIAVSLTLGVWLTRTRGAMSTLSFGFVASIGAVLLLWVFGPLPALCLLTTGAMGLVQGAGFAAVPELNEPIEDRALANGAMAQMGNLGNTIGIPLAVVAMHVFGFSGLLGMTAAVLAAGFAAHMALSRLRGW